jgi:hypothetical protein
VQSEHIHKLQRDNASVFKLPSAVHQNIEWLATHLNHVLKFKGSLDIISKTYFPSSHVFKFALSIFPHQISNALARERRCGGHGTDRGVLDIMSHQKIGY